MNKAEVNNADTEKRRAVLQDQAQDLRREAPEVFNKQMESPITIRFRGINITPGGYAAAEFVRRSRALGADVPTPFNSLTMPGASQSQLSEFFGSGRQSKDHHLCRRACGERGSFQLRLGRLPLCRRHLHL